MFKLSGWNTATTHLRVALLNPTRTSFNDANGLKMASLQKRRFSKPLILRVSASKRKKTFICSQTRSKINLLVQLLSSQNARRPLKEKQQKGLAKVMLKSKFSWKTQFSMYSTKRLNLILTCSRIMRTHWTGPIQSNHTFLPNQRSRKATSKSIYMTRRFNTAPSPPWHMDSTKLELRIQYLVWLQSFLEFT